jgi:hypothetical protein
MPLTPSLVLSKRGGATGEAAVNKRGKVTLDKVAKAVVVARRTAAALLLRQGK